MAAATGVTPTTPAGITQIAGWKANKFAPAPGKARFPDVGAAAPGSQDASAVGVTPGQSYSLTLPTNEPYWVAFLDAGGNVKLHFLVGYAPPAYQAPIMVCGVGNPTTLGVPAVANSVYFDVNPSDPGAGSRVFVARGGSWVTAA